MTKQSTSHPPFDVGIIGAGMSGMTAALLLAAQGKRVALMESHVQPGGCAGYFRRKGYCFDVGATTFISFQPGGIGHTLTQRIGLEALPLTRIENYALCLPDRRVVIPHDADEWPSAWANAFPELGMHGLPFFEGLLKTAQDYWRIASGFPHLPLQTPRDLFRSLKAVPVSTLPSLRWFHKTLGQYLSAQNIPLTSALEGAIGMLLQDTTQAGIDSVPAPNALLGLTLMPHGLYRPVGGTRQLWETLQNRFTELGGVYLRRHRVVDIKQDAGPYLLSFDRTIPTVSCDWLISSIPVWNTHAICPELFGDKLTTHIAQRQRLDGAFALYLGVHDIFGELDCLHYQVLRKLETDLDDGNNFLISLSAKGDERFAPPGQRSVTISTHTDPERWQHVSVAEQRSLGEAIIERFLDSAESLFPGFREAIIQPHFYPASPLTYARFTGRYKGIAGNQPLSLLNANMNAIPSRFGAPKFLQIGDTTFPGAGTVACMLSGFNAYRECMGWRLRL